MNITTNIARLIPGIVLGAVLFGTEAVYHYKKRWPDCLADEIPLRWIQFIIALAVMCGLIADVFIVLSVTVAVRLTMAIAIIGTPLIASIIDKGEPDQVGPS